MFRALNLSRNINKKYIPSQTSITTHITKKLSTTAKTLDPENNTRFSKKAMEQHQKVLKIIESNKYIHEFCVKYFYSNSLEFTSFQGPEPDSSEELSQREYVRGLYNAIYTLLYKEPTSTIDAINLRTCNRHILKDIYTSAGVDDSLQILIKELDDDLNFRMNELISKTNPEEEVCETMKVDDSVKC